MKYDDCTSVGVALHLTNTVFIDRALVVIPIMESKLLVLNLLLFFDKSVFQVLPVVNKCEYSKNGWSCQDHNDFMLREFGSN